jgi:hypothetical protein
MPIGMLPDGKTKSYTMLVLFYSDTGTIGTAYPI